MITFVAPATLARSNPTIRASYSASLLVVRKLSRIMHSILSPFGEWITHRLLVLICWTIRLCGCSLVLVHLPLSPLCWWTLRWNQQRPVLLWLFAVNTICQTHLTQLPIAPFVQLLQGYSLPFAKVCPLRRPQCGLESMAWVSEL